jgi:hypothetical protein
MSGEDEDDNEWPWASCTMVLLFWLRSRKMKIPKKWSYLSSLLLLIILIDMARTIALLFLLRSTKH